MPTNIRIVFMGTPDFAVASLEALTKVDGVEIVGVITAPDKPAGRGRKIQCSAVKQFALDNQLAPILQPTNLKDSAFQDELYALSADIFVVVAFRMLPEAVWSMPPKGTINLHASLLPQFRGAAPINWAIINGQKQTGVTTFFIEKEIDTGDIIDQSVVDIDPNETAGTLHDKLMLAGAELLANTVLNIHQGKATGKKQSHQHDGQALHSAPKIFKDDCCINWQQPTHVVYNFIRGLAPYPAAWSQLFNANDELATFKIYSCNAVQSSNNKTPGTIESDGKTFFKVATIDGYIDIIELQQAGKKRMKTDEFLRGFSISNQMIFRIA